MAKKILVIDDEVMILDAIRIIFEDLGIEVRTTPDPAAGAKDAAETAYDLVLTDLRMPVMNGAEIVEQVRARRPDARILVITGYPNDPLVERALTAGAIGLLRKPFEIAAILEWLGKP
jgi:CheY-like chemotaxis protein